MKSTWPPPQVILVGLESNQHGQAASQEQASSSCPVIFHGVLSLGGSAARTNPTKQKSAASAPDDERVSNFIFIACEFTVGGLSQTSRFCRAFLAHKFGRENAFAAGSTNSGQSVRSTSAKKSATTETVLVEVNLEI